jgi:hypothetical protein
VSVVQPHYDGPFRSVWGRPLRGRNLVLPGSLAAPLALTRTQAGSARSTALGADGATWQEYAADIARFSGTARRLLIEGARTNSVANPRFEGGTAGVIGSGGTWPTGVSLSSTAGLTYENLGVFTTNGTPRLRVRVSGTATSSASVFLTWVSGVVASTGQVWTSSVNVRTVSLVSGSIFAAANTRIRISSNITGNESFSAPIQASINTNDNRFSHTGTLASVGVTAISTNIICAVTNAVAYDHTVEFGMPQLELAPFASTPIFPPVGTPGASTRSADIVTASLASLGVAL